MSPSRLKPTQPLRPATREGLLLWVIHRFGEAFEQCFILKGGMSLRLLDSPRHTNDVDLVLAPFGSKREALPVVEGLLSELDGASVSMRIHSKMIRADVRLDGVGVQVEVAVAHDCDSVPMATAALAEPQGIPSQIVRIMAPDLALAHKLAAWNERRLLRDLFDAYFLQARVGASPNLPVLRERLATFRSRLPALRRRRKMSLSEFLDALTHATDSLSDVALQEELAGLLSVDEFAGLELRMRAALNRLLEILTP